MFKRAGENASIHSPIIVDVPKTNKNEESCFLLSSLRTLFQKWMVDLMNSVNDEIFIVCQWKVFFVFFFLTKECVPLLRLYSSSAEF